MTPLEIAERRLDELRESITVKHMRVCNMILEGVASGVAWQKIYKTKKLATAQASSARMLGDVKNGAREYIDLMKWVATASAQEKLGINEFKILSNLNTVSDRCLALEPMRDKDGELITERDADGRVYYMCEFNQTGAIKANELMGKHIGMFKEQVEVSASDQLRDLVEKVRDNRQGGSPLPSGL